MKTINLVRLTQQLYDARAHVVREDDAASVAAFDALLAITVARAAGRGLAAAVDEALTNLLADLETVA